MTLRRIWVVFRKELIDALRDRRTLVAMILVPLLLYPVLMVVVVQALQFEKGRREKETYRVAVPDERHRAWLQAVLDADAAQRAAQTPETQAADALRAVIRSEQFEISVRTGPLEEAVRTGAVQLALRTDPPPPERGLGADVNRTVQLWYDPAEFGSDVAFKSLSLILARRTERTVIERLEAAGLPQDTLDPLRVEEHSVASPQKLGGALLGQILPFLLVIMTITGAIYPAIDLTAGERERGTLETLMVAPVPVAQVVAGKFIVVVTIALLSTALNLASMGATVRFGGIGAAMARSAGGEGSVSIPLAVLPIVLLAMVPFAVLFAAVMMATCSVARTFKEAQNYMTPVMMAALLPAMITSYMPSVKLSGAVMVLPVANVVVLVRELFLGHYDVPAILMAFTSTCLYAATAVVVAGRLYGQEAVLFSDVGSYRALLSRRLMRPAPLPSPSAALLLVAVVFPLSFYWQTAMATPDMSAPRLMGMTIVQMAAVFLAPAVALAWYLKLDLRETFSLRAPPAGATAGAILIAVAAPVLLQALARRQLAWFPPGEELSRALEAFQERMLELPPAAMLLAFAVLPGVCEELLFRGFVLSGLRRRLRPLWLCVVVGVLFGLFHVDLYRIPATSLLGTIIALVCWKSGSIYLCMLIHVVNNAAALLAARHEGLALWLGMADTSPTWIVPAAATALAAGLSLVTTTGRARSESAG